MTDIKYNLRENKQLLARLLTEEPLVSSEADKYPKWTPSKAWTGTYAKYESLLKAMGAKPYPRPFGEQANYEMRVGDDYIRFYDDGTAYSTNNSQEMGYGIDTKLFAMPGTPNKPRLTLYDKLGGEQIHGYIENNNGKLTFIPPDAEDAVKEEPETWVDYVQYALSLVGVIPGFGDIADIVNAGISFMRGNYLDGFINLIGAIPVVGSAISIPFKAAMKGLKGVGNMLEAAWRGKRGATEVWAKLHASGTLDPNTLNMLADGMGTIGNVIKGFRNRADWVLSNQAARSLDEFADFMQANRRTAKDVFSGSAKRADDLVQGGQKMGRGKGILKTRADADWGIVSKLLPKKFTRAIGNAFSRTLSVKELGKLKGAMYAKFARKADNPATLSSIAKTNLPGGGGFVNSLDGARDIEIFLRGIKNTDPRQYEIIKSQILSKAVADKNPLLTNFINSETNALKTFMTQPGTFISSAFSRWQNMAPIIWGDIKDMGEDVLMTAGIETKDDINGLFWPLFKKAVDAAEYVPVVGDAIGWAKKNAVEPAGKAIKWASKIPVIGAGIATAKNALGVDTDKSYDPNVEFQIVPDDDPGLKQQELEKEKRIQQNKRY